MDVVEREKDREKQAQRRANVTIQVARQASQKDWAGEQETTVRGAADGEVAPS
jgi:hypothetical protein